MTTPTNRLKRAFAKTAKKHFLDHIPNQEEYQEFLRHLSDHEWDDAFMRDCYEYYLEYNTSSIKSLLTILPGFSLFSRLFTSQRK